MTRRMTKTERFATERMYRNLRALEDESVVDDLIRDLCPDAWRTLHDDLDVREKKVHVTLRLDASVAAFYRAMGQGYQARINRILTTYAQLRIAKAEMFEREFSAWRKEMRRTGSVPGVTRPDGSSWADPEQPAPNGRWLPSEE